MILLSILCLFIVDCLSVYKEVFETGLGCYTGGRASPRLRAGAKPVFCRARPLPYALREREDAEPDDAEPDAKPDAEHDAKPDAEHDATPAAGVVEPVEHSDRVTPLDTINIMTLTNDFRKVLINKTATKEIQQVIKRLETFKVPVHPRIKLFYALLKKTVTEYSYRTSDTLYSPNKYN